MYLQTEAPIVLGTPFEEFGATWIKIICPYCEREHIHSWPEDSTPGHMEHRGVHCKDGTSTSAGQRRFGYWIKGAVPHENG